MSNYMDSVVCPHCGETFLGAFIDMSHVYNHTLNATCPSCGRVVINRQYQEYIGRMEKVVE